MGDTDKNSYMETPAGLMKSAVFTAVHITCYGSNDDYYNDMAELYAEAKAEFMKTAVEDAQIIKRAEEFEKAIMYIIRLEQPKKGGTLSTVGTTQSNGYDTAHEGDTVTLKVNVKKGYKVVAAYNGTDQKVQLVQDAKGDYYIVVPKGGGVTLSVALKLVRQNYTPREKALVSVYTDGGKVPGRKAGDFTITTNVGSKINTPKKPVKEGYKFLGWYVSETETEFDYEKLDPAEADLLKAEKPFKVEGDVNLIAVWQQQ